MYLFQTNSHEFEDYQNCHMIQGALEHLNMASFYYVTKALSLFLGLFLINNRSKAVDHWISEYGLSPACFKKDK
jgi:hypothetical protein